MVPPVFIGTCWNSSTAIVELSTGSRTDARLDHATNLGSRATKGAEREENRVAAPRPCRPPPANNAAFGTHIALRPGLERAQPGARQAAGPVAAAQPFGSLRGLAQVELGRSENRDRK